MQFGYILIKDKHELVAVGFADFVSDLMGVINTYSNGDITYDGPGCYGRVIVHGSYTMTYWHSEYNGYADIKHVMDLVLAELNHGGMIKSHNE